MARIRVREEVILEQPGAEGVLLGDRVREAGLDPEVFIAVIPAECGRAGKVNKNRRIYPVPEGVAEHERLCREAPTRSIPGHLGHPETSEDWKLVVRFLGGSTKIESDGSATFKGNLGILNTALGRDTLTVWKAGFPIGTSSYGWGSNEDHKIDESSPFLAMNPDHKGETISLIKGWELDWYDLVRVASADTYLPASESVRESAQRLREAFNENPEEVMFKNLKEFEAAHPDLAKTLREEAVAAEKTAAEQSLKAEKDRAVAAEAKLAEAEQKVKDAEVAQAGASDTLTKMQERVEALEKKDSRNALRLAVNADVGAFVKGRPAGSVILSQVLEDFDAGRFASVEDAHKEAERKVAIAAGVVPGLSGRTVESPDGSLAPVLTNSKASEKVSKFLDS